MTGTRDIETLLRDLDSAADEQGVPGLRRDALLERVVATGTARDQAAAATPAPSEGGARRKTRAVLVTGGLVAATTAGLLVLPPLLGGGDSAYASWTAVPDGLSTQERHDAVEDCRDAQDDTPGPVDESSALRGATAAIAERRGDWITVVLAGPDGFSATCTTDASDPFGRGWIGSSGTLPADQAPGPRDLRATGLGVAYTSGPLSMAEGYAGTEVTAVSYDSPVHGRVVATVNAGHFALWMPGDEFDDDMVLNTGVPVDVTYTDGTTDTLNLTLQ